MQTVVTEEYVSCVTQQICGKVYGPNEVVPGADLLPTLPALLRTNRIRTKPKVVITPDDPDSAQDIGSAQAQTPTEKRAATVTAKKAAKKTKAGVL